MAEIKSAIELAMERTRNLVMDEEEKRESRNKEIENKVRAILKRYLESIIEADQALEDVAEVKAPEGQKRRLLANLVLEEFDITALSPRVLDVLRHVVRCLPGSFMGELDAILSEFGLSMEKEEGVVREKIRERLDGMGIAGDGLEPNVEAWEEWTQAREETAQAFKERIDEWKRRLLGAMDND
jgi:hypothetical protein